MANKSVIQCLTTCMHVWMHGGMQGFRGLNVWKREATKVFVAASWRHFGSGWKHDKKQGWTVARLCGSHKWTVCVDSSLIFSGVNLMLLWQSNYTATSVAPRDFFLAALFPTGSSERLAIHTNSHRNWCQIAVAGLSQVAPHFPPHFPQATPIRGRRCSTVYVTSFAKPYAHD